MPVMYGDSSDGPRCGKYDRFSVWFAISFFTFGQQVLQFNAIYYTDANANVQHYQKRREPIMWVYPERQIGTGKQENKVSPGEPCPTQYASEIWLVSLRPHLTDLLGRRDDLSENFYSSLVITDSHMQTIAN
jgi:hypothetical protein